MTLDDELDVILAGDDSFAAGTESASTALMQHDEVMGASPESAGVILGIGYVLVRASAFPGLVSGQAATVNSDPYRVTQVMRIMDGKVLQVYLGSPDESNDD